MNGFTGKYLDFDFFIDINFLLLLFYASVLGSLIRVCLIYILNQKFLNNTNNAIMYALLPPIGYLITSVISSNIALSLGMVGALSIIRFRTPVKNPVELVYYFMLLTLGIVLNVNRNFAVNFVIYILLISTILIIGIKLLVKIDLINYNMNSNLYYLNLELKHVDNNLKNNKSLIHISSNNKENILLFKDSNKETLLSLLDNLDKENLISYSLELDSDEM